MSVTNFVSGVASFGVPILGSGPVFTTGNIWFVDSGTGGAGGPGTLENPYSTIDAAIGRCTASNGDVIICLPGHNETVTAAIAADVAGITIIGIGNGSNMATVTQGTSGSLNCLEVSADNVTIQNMRFEGSNTGTNEPFIDIQKVDYTTIRDCVFVQHQKNLDCITIQGPGSDYVTIEGCKFIGAAAGPDNAILFENITTSTSNLNPIIRNCYFNYTGSAGCDNGCICVSHSSGATVGMLIENCTFIGLANSDAAINAKGMAATRCTGLMNNIAIHSADATDVLVVSNMLGAINVYAVEAGTRPYGAVSGSGMAPLLTAAA